VSEVARERVERGPQVDAFHLAELEEVTAVFGAVDDPLEAVRRDPVVGPRLVREVVTDEFLLGAVDPVRRLVLADDDELAVPFGQPEVRRLALDRAGRGALARRTPRLSVQSDGVDERPDEVPLGPLLGVVVEVRDRERLVAREDAFDGSRVADRVGQRVEERRENGAERRRETGRAFGHRVGWLPIGQVSSPTRPVG
jgi:hypothetical protein